MAEPLNSRYGPRIPQRIAAMIERLHPSVASRAVVEQALRAFEPDPALVIALLERLRDDPDPAVRRSVAKHLNDLGRADPARLVALCTRWAQDAPPARLRLIRHALRTLVKRADPHALAVLGYGRRARITLRDASIEPASVPIGGSVAIVFALASTSRRAQRILVDLRVTHAGARGVADRTRVFKLVAVELDPLEVLPLRRRLSLRQMSTRVHHPGLHRVEILVNGEVLPVGRFEVTAGSPDASRRR